MRVVKKKEELLDIYGKFTGRTHQLGTFSVNGEWICGGLFDVSGEIRTHRSRTRNAGSARPLRVILDSVGYH